jgi:hypothetical protein
MTDTSSSGLADASIPDSLVDPPHAIARDEAAWLVLRRELLEEEKAMTKAKEALAAKP